MRKCWFVLIVLILSRITSGGLQTEIRYTAENQSGNQWIYQYDIANLALEEGIREITIWFDQGKYSGLQITSDPILSSGWDQIIWQPNEILKSNGGFDALVKTSPISIGQNVSGFAVSFNWLGTGTPGRQYYEIINPKTYEVISNGYTIPYPEPSTILLMALGSGLLLGYRRK